MDASSSLDGPKSAAMFPTTILGLKEPNPNHDRKINRATELLQASEEQILARFAPASELRRPILPSRSSEPVTLAELVWHDLEEPGALLAQAQQLSTLHETDVTKLMLEYWPFKPGANEQRIILMGYGLLTINEIIVGIQNSRSTLGNLLRDTYRHALKIRITETHLSLMAFHEQWKKQMCGTPFQVLSSYDIVSDLTKPVVPTSNGQYQLLAELALNAAIEPSAVDRVLQTLKTLDSTQWAALIRQSLDEQSLRVTIALLGLLDGKSVWSVQEFLEALETKPNSKAAQYFLKLRYNWIQYTLQQLTKHLDSWRHQPPLTTDLTPLDPIQE
ncbi:hypothetical protein HY524_02140 [Candidatus Berkelbacteria bacterium]|nr:hypothetical protein [Candidatus Berkelbacteria bacterium]